VSRYAAIISTSGNRNFKIGLFLYHLISELSVVSRPRRACDVNDSQLTTDNSLLKHAPKLFTETGKIDWTKPVDDIYNLIRGLSPYPAAFALLQDKTMKIYRAKKEHATTVAAAGEWKTDQKSFLKFAGADGYTHVTELQLEGKKKMKIEDFLRGYRS